MQLTHPSVDILLCYCNIQLLQEEEKERRATEEPSTSSRGSVSAVLTSMKGWGLWMVCLSPQKQKEAKPRVYHSGVGRYIPPSSSGAGGKRPAERQPQASKKGKIRSSLGDFSGW